MAQAPFLRSATMQEAMNPASWALETGIWPEWWGGGQQEAAAPVQAPAAAELPSPAPMPPPAPAPASPPPEMPWQWQQPPAPEPQPSSPPPPRYEPPPEPSITPRTDPLSSEMGWPVSPPPSQKQLNDVWYGPNSSNGNFPAAQMPTFTNNPEPMKSNAIPVGDIPGRTAAGLLSARNDPNGYIQGLLGQHNPGNWRGGLADMLSKSVPQATPLLDTRRGGSPAVTQAATSAAAAPAASAVTGPDGQPWNTNNGGVIIGWHNRYPANNEPVYGPPGSTPSQAFV